jgi:hypothetical protein
VSVGGRQADSELQVFRGAKVDLGAERAFEILSAAPDFE